MRDSENQGLPVQIWVPSEQQIKAALELIQPAPKVRALCRIAIVQALERIEWAKLWVYAPGAVKRKLNNYAKKLRAIDDSEIRHYLTKSVVDEVTRLRKWFAQTADKLEVRHGSKQKSKAKRIAVEFAYAILASFRKTPSLTYRGIWHKLALILYGGKAADLFDYMRESYRLRKF